MSIVQTSYITISCDGPECDKTATFAATEQGNAEAIIAHPWLTTHRAIQTPDRRNLGYCSDECEAKGIQTGAHNKLEKRIVPGNASGVELAARAAADAKRATEQLKQGGGITLG